MDDEDKTTNIDPLDQPGDLIKAKLHGRAQQVLNLDNFNPIGSKLT
jgi:hypothetical protein